MTIYGTFTLILSRWTLVKKGIALTHTPTLIICINVCSNAYTLLYVLTYGYHLWYTTQLHMHTRRCMSTRCLVLHAYLCIHVLICRIPAQIYWCTSMHVAHLLMHSRTWHTLTVCDTLRHAYTCTWCASNFIASASRKCCHRTRLQFTVIQINRKQLLGQGGAGRVIRYESARNGTGSAENAYFRTHVHGRGQIFALVRNAEFRGVFKVYH